VNPSSSWVAGPAQPLLSARSGCGAQPIAPTTNRRAAALLAIRISRSPARAQAIDDWRRRQDDLPTRATAIRRLVEIGLKSKAKGQSPANVPQGSQTSQAAALFNELRLLCRLSRIRNRPTVMTHMTYNVGLLLISPKFPNGAHIEMCVTVRHASCGRTQGRLFDTRLPCTQPRLSKTAVIRLRSDVPNCRLGMSRARSAISETSTSCLS
jgi:hypothetical protein